MMHDLPKQMTVCTLDSAMPEDTEVLLMPNGEVLCMGRTLGWFNELKGFLTPKS